MSFAEKFTNLLEKSETTPYRMSKETGIPEATIGRWKNGKAIPNGEKLQAIANYFNVSVDYLLGNEQKIESFTKTEGFSKEAWDLTEKIEKLSPANRAKMSELIDLYLSAQDKK